MGHAQDQKEETSHEKERSDNVVSWRQRGGPGGDQHLQASLQVRMGEVDEVFALRGDTDAGDGDLGLARLEHLELLRYGAHDLDVIHQAEAAGNVSPELDAEARQGRPVLNVQRRQPFRDHPDVRRRRSQVRGGRGTAAQGQPAMVRQGPRRNRPRTRPPRPAGAEVGGIGVCHALGGHASSRVGSPGVRCSPLCTPRFHAACVQRHAPRW